jgi:esterase/lipase superfamily enzyme
MIRPALVLGASLTLVACSGPRGYDTLDPAATGDGSPQTLIVAASSQPVAGADVFGPGRSETLRFARFVVSVPPERKAGTISWPGRSGPDPRTDFVTLDARWLGGPDAFIAAVEAQMRGGGHGEAMLFVHGYNETFAEGLYRQAQIRHDFRIPDASVNFAWPSIGKYQGYVYDKESVIFAADNLAATLDLMARSSAERIVLVAHSMGALLTMEALHVMALRDDRRGFDKLHAVVLMAPDVGLDLFTLRMRQIERYAVPFFV